MSRLQKIEQVEPFFGHSIYKNNTEMVIVGASLDNKSKALLIQAVDVYGKELSMTSISWFYSAKYMGHPFGKKMNLEDEE